MSLISREETLKAFESIPTINGLGLEPLIALRDVKEIIKSVPEVDAVPVVHGRWIVHGEAPIFIIECSVCNQHYFNHEKQEKAKYCGMCGARMNLEEQNENK